MASAYRTDAYHNLEMAEASKKGRLYSREEMRAKIMVLLHMSIECSLKCAIALQDPEGDLVETYRILKTGGHDLKKLLKHVDSPDFDDVREAIKSFNPPGVGLRYGLELLALDPDRLFASGRSPELQNKKIKEAFQLAIDVYDVVSRLHKARYKQMLKWEAGDTPKRVINRFKDANRRRWK